MIAVRRDTDADADAVWRVLSDGWLYPAWVVGASRMRRVEDHWPDVGARLHHSVGTWPVLIDDTTHVTGAEPGRELRLRARGWPLGEADIRLRLEPRAGGGCSIVMEEDIATGPTKVLPRPARVAMIVPRNKETLRRLSYLAEAGAR